MQNATSYSKIANIYLLVIFSLSFTAAHYLPLFRHAMLFFIVGFFLSIVISSSFLKSKAFLGWLFYIIIVAFNVLLGDFYFKETMSLVYEMTYLFIPASMVFYAFSNKDYNFEKKSLLLFCIIIFLMTIATVYFSQLYQGIVRNTYMYEEDNAQGFYESLYKYGLISYTGAHALPCLIPALVSGIKCNYSNGRVKWLLILMMASLLLIAYYSGSLACLLYSFFGFVLSLIIKPGDSKNKVIVVLIIGYVFFLMISNPLINYLSVNMGEGNDFYLKVIDFQSMKNGNDSNTDFDTRQMLYNQSLEQAIPNILIGGDGSALGGHSSFLDRFGSLGLLGVIPFLFFGVHIISFTIKNIPSEYRLYYWIGLIVGLFMFVTKSVNSWDFWFSLLFVLPTLIHYFSRQECQ